jgi:hypothetical protein
MRANVGDRLRHITDAIANIRFLLAGKTIELIENQLRHALWNIYVYELDALEAANKALAPTSGKGAH